MGILLLFAHSHLTKCFKIILGSISVNLDGITVSAPALLPIIGKLESTLCHISSWMPVRVILAPM